MATRHSSRKRRSSRGAAQGRPKVRSIPSSDEAAAGWDRLARSAIRNEGKEGTEPSDEGPVRRRTAEPDSLGHAIEVQRKRLFQAQAIVQAIARLLTETFAVEVDEPDSSLALTAAGDLLEDVIAQLEPLRLGLGVPTPRT